MILNIQQYNPKWNTERRWGQKQKQIENQTKIDNKAIGKLLGSNILVIGNPDGRGTKISEQ